MDKIIRIYISDYVDKPVAQSQIFNWGQILKDKGINSLYIIFYKKGEDVEKMCGNNNADICKVKTLNSFILRNCIHFFALSYQIILLKKKHKKIICQTRTISVAPSLKLVKLFFGIKSIADIRGFEIENLTRKNFKNRIKLFNHNVYHKLLLNSSDIVFCVSKALINCLVSYYHIKNTDKFKVFAGAADQNDFYFSPDKRETLRRLYNLDNKIVILYSGMLDKTWQIPDTYFKFFIGLKSHINNLILFFLTTNIKLAEGLRIKYNLSEEQVLIKEANYNELVDYYHLADYGLLFRTNEVVNNVASPTKFAEYLLSGVPVIITKSIIDSAEYVEKNNCGYVIDSINKFSEKNYFESDIKEYLLTPVSIDKKKSISNNAKPELSKQSLIKSVIEIYQEI